ncbi:MAG: UDP-glucose 4-epimerase GalE [Bacteroidetes bacterium]|nr:UDP-glucose 4-epimerase GalE [Bacteroidota bacterium]
MKKTILVTGGTGYIGSHTAVELISRKFSVKIIDNLSNSSVDTVNTIRRITGVRPHFTKLDLCDAKALAGWFRRNRDVIAVIHFAALKSVGESEKRPLDYYRNNILSTVNLLHELNVNHISSLVFSSSCTVYGEPDSNPVTEKSSIKPAASVYGNTKRICEEIIRDAAKEFPLRAISLRYFNPVGAHSSGLIGDSPVNPSDNLLPAITQTASGKRNILNVYGNDYPTPDGTPVRDYIHVVDLAKAHVAAIERLIGKKNNTSFEVFNLGTGRGYSVFEIINAFSDCTGVRLNFKITSRRPGDMTSIWADTAQANKELGWEAGLTLDDMVRTAWAWEQNHNKKSAAE